MRIKNHWKILCRPFQKQTITTASSRNRLLVCYLLSSATTFSSVVTCYSPTILMVAPRFPNNHSNSFESRRVTRQSLRLMQSMNDHANDKDDNDINNNGSNLSSTSIKDDNTIITPTTPARRRTRRTKVVTPDTDSSSNNKRATRTPSSASTPAKKRKQSPSSKQLKAKKSVMNTTPPTGWQEIYTLVEELRQDRSAPVDSDGSEALPDKSADPKTWRFQVLIALMLSSQTKDAVVGETMRRLQAHGLTVENLSKTSKEDLNALIFKVGFHNNKTKYIQQTVEILKDKYKGDIPPCAKTMMELPGVGPKMAFIVENVAWGKQSGIGIDTHMHRMFNELRWVKSKNPEQTRVQLEAWLPKEYWPSVNLLWVGMGQEVQQFKPKLLRKALDCSRPKEALKLVKRLGLDYHKEGKKLGLEEEIQAVLRQE